MITRKNIKSILVLTSGLIASLFTWFVLKSLANSSFSAHDPDPWIQTLVEHPKTFKKNAINGGWFKIISQDGELLWAKNATEFLALENLPVLHTKTVFLVQASGPKAAHQLYTYLKTTDSVQKVIIISPSDGFLKDMQFYDGNLQLSCGQAYLIRLRMLNQLGIANLMKTNMSVAWIEEPLFSQDIHPFILMFKKRRVPVFIGPNNISDPNTASANVLID